VLRKVGLLTRDRRIKSSAASNPPSQVSPMTNSRMNTP